VCCHPLDLNLGGISRKAITSSAGSANNAASFVSVAMTNPATDMINSHTDRYRLIRQCSKKSAVSKRMNRRMGSRNSDLHQRTEYRRPFTVTEGNGIYEEDAYRCRAEKDVQQPHRMNKPDTGNILRKPEE
jgi:hypothetical protein